MLVAVGGKFMIDWLWAQPEPSLIAKVKFGPLVMPPTWINRLEALKAGVENDGKAIGRAEEELLAAIYSDALFSKASNAGTSGDKEAARKQFRAALSEVLSGKEDMFRECQVISSTGLKFPENGLPEFRELLHLTENLGGYWHLDVVNNGTAQADAVSVDLPDAQFAVVSRASGVSNPIQSPVSISLGGLGPKESVQIYGWTRREPFDFEAENIVIRHSKGLAAVDVYVPMPAIWSKLERLITFAWLPILGLLMILVGSVISLFRLKELPSIIANIVSKSIEHQASSLSPSTITDVPESKQKPRKLTKRQADK